MLLVGIDWAQQEHVYCLMDEGGTVLATGTVPNTAEGLHTLLGRIRTQPTDPAEVCVALETHAGPLVGELLEYGFIVYAINPKAVERHRERFRVAGAKSDLRDAWVLAHLLRTDRALYRALTPDSEVAQELLVLTRDRAALVKTRTMLSNQLRACLQTYFPEFLDLWDDPDRPVALALLQAYPTLEALQAVPVGMLTAFLRQHHQPHSAAKAQEIATRLSRPTFRIRPVLVRTKARLAVTLAQQLATLSAQIAAYEAEIRRVLKIHPDGELYLSLPGAGHCLVARMVGELGDNRARYADAAAAQCEAGTAPVTKASGQSRTVQVRRACNHSLRETMWLFAFCSLRQCAWAQDYYARARVRGKKHAEAVRMLANVWMRIIIAMRRDRRPYNEGIFLRARAARFALAS